MKSTISMVAAMGLAGLFAQPAAAQNKHLVLTGISSATTAPAGMFFASYSHTTQGIFGGTDSSAAIGFGMGDANETVGVQVTAQLANLYTGFGRSGYIQFKFSRRVSDTVPLYAGVQLDNFLAWGDSNFVPPSFKGGVSYFTNVQYGGEVFPVIMTVGAGSAIRNFGSTPGVYAGIGVGLTERIGASVSYSGDYFNLGAGFKVTDNISISGTVNDVFNQDFRRRVTLSVSYNFSNAYGG